MSNKKMIRSNALGRFSNWVEDQINAGIDQVKNTAQEAIGMVGLVIQSDPVQKAVDTTVTSARYTSAFAHGLAEGTVTVSAAFAGYGLYLVGDTIRQAGEGEGPDINIRIVESDPTDTDVDITANISHENADTNTQRISLNDVRMSYIDDSLIEYGNIMRYAGITIMVAVGVKVAYDFGPVAVSGAKRSYRYVKSKLRRAREDAVTPATTPSSVDSRMLVK